MTAQRVVYIVIIVGLVGFLGWWFGWPYYKSSVSEPIAQRRAAIEQFKQQIAYFETQAKTVPSDMTTLQGYSARSLPSDWRVAQVQYRMWLTELAEFSGIEDPVVDAGQPAPRGAMYSTIRFTVGGRCTLDQLTRFLYEFYYAPHLHQILDIQINSVRDKEQSVVDVSMTIETVVLPTASRTNQLAVGVYRRLTSLHLASYSPIAKRDMLAVKRIRTKADPAQYAVINAVNTVDGKPEAWLNLRTEDRTLILHEGHEIDVGSFQGTVAEIVDSDMLVESGGRTLLFTIGDSLLDGFPLPPEK